MSGRWVVLLGVVGLIGCTPPGGSRDDDDGGPEQADQHLSDDGGMSPDDGGRAPDDGVISDGDVSDGTVRDGEPIEGDAGPEADAAPGADAAPETDAAPPDTGPIARMEECNAEDDDLDGAIDEGGVCPLPPATSIGPPGATIDLAGALDENSPVWQRFDVPCGVRAQGDFRYAALRIVNRGARDRVVELTADWGEVDGFLHVFSDPFDPAGDGCIAGSDDHTGQRDSQIASQAIEAGQTLTIVASTYRPDMFMPAFTIRMRTVPDTELRCDDGFDDDQDGAVDCADLDCDADPVCDACFGVECRPGAQCEEGECVDFATPLGRVGESIRFEGELPPGAPVYDRPTDACRATGETVTYTTWSLVNRTGDARMVQLDMYTPGELGFAAIFGYPFDPDRPVRCLAGAGGVPGDRDRRRIQRVRIEPDEVVVAVVSSGFEDGPIDAFEVEVTTLPDDPGIELTCDDRVDDDRDGSPGCADWNCAIDPVCRPCDGIVCGADERCVDGVCAPERGAEPIELAFSGDSVIIAGAIDADDPLWTRPSEDCQPGEEGGHHYEAVRLVTPEGFPMTVTLTIEWDGGDGFMHVFSDPFDPDDIDGCLAASDDDGGIERSRVDDLAIERNGSIVVIASTYNPDRRLPGYILRVTSEPPAD